MAGLLDGLESLGLGGLQGASIFEEEKKTVAKPGEKAEPVIPPEEEFLLNKEFDCPVCGKKFSAKIIKSGRAKLLGQDPDLRPRYEGIDSNKYDVLLCGKCGYAALKSFHGGLLSTQIKLIKENISANIKLTKYTAPTYSYEQALERYKIALANAVVKKGKLSERAYICLKTAWLIRGMREQMIAENKAPAEEILSLEKQELEYIKNAYQGFYEARSKENPPIAGMDSTTLDYLLAQLAYKLGDYGTSLKMIESIITTGNNPRLKNKAIDLKDAVKEAKAKAKDGE
jgi:uncharacterized protein (DUF2225 family)